jgi:hypothetical protein
MTLRCICSLLGRQSEVQLSGEQRALDGRPINHPNPALSCLMLINYHTGNCPRTLCRLSFHIGWQHRLHIPTNTLVPLKTYGSDILLPAADRYSIGVLCPGWAGNYR